MHHDERYWDKPWDFIPERFLDEDGHLVTADHPNRRRYMQLLFIHLTRLMLYPDSGIPMDEEIGLGNMFWSYSKAEL